MQTDHLLDNVRMSEVEREHAKAHMRSAELTIDFILMTAGSAEDGTGVSVEQFRL